MKSYLLCIMKYLKNILIKLLPKDLPKPLGRWKIENCNTKMNNKIDLSNEDHCGTCGEYALKKIETRDNHLEKMEKLEKLEK